MQQLPPFYIGQKVISILSHLCGLHKKGDKFIVTGVFKKCCDWTITIGITSEKKYSQCYTCKQDYLRGTLEVQFGSIAFAPIEEQEFKQVTFEKILEEMPVGAN